MPRDIDEDLIEATIRRVAESKAAREDSATAAPAEPDAVPDVLRDRDEGASGPAAVSPDEDAIEATIRRVAEAKAARDALADAPAPAAAPLDDGAGDEATDDPAAAERSLERLRFDDDGRSGPRRFSATSLGGVVKSPWAQFRPAGDDDDDVEPTDDAALPPDHDTPAATDAQTADAGADVAETGVAESPPTSDRAVPAAAARPAPRRPVEAGPDVTTALAEITTKLDAVLSLLDRLTSASSRPSSGDWASAGRVVTLGAPARPGLRDPRAATAEQLAPDDVDRRPLPPPPPPLHVEPKRGLELLPRTYRITVEDKRRGVDLVPLHRALLGMEGVKDMSLLSYNNGVAIVALETSGDLDPEALRAAISRAMSREAKVEVHNENTMVVKLAEE